MAYTQALAEDVDAAIERQIEQNLAERQDDG
jgi:hypothetical protein